MKIEIVSKKDFAIGAGIMDHVVKKALALKGTKTIKMDCGDKTEAVRMVGLIRSSVRRMKLTDGVDWLRRKNVVYVYPIDKEV